MSCKALRGWSLQYVDSLQVYHGCQSSVLRVKYPYMYVNSYSILTQLNSVYCSLNREKRTRELLRVTRENQEILGRIMKKRPEYDHKKWQGDWMQNQM